MKLSFPIDEFLKRTAGDSRLLPTHINLFMAVFYYSDENDALAAFQVCRRKLMLFSRIRSVSTYHKCMNDLVAFGHLIYEPSYDPFKGSKISIICKKTMIKLRFNRSHLVGLATCECPFPLKEKEQAEVRQSLTFTPFCYRKGVFVYTPGILWTAVADMK